MTPFNPVLSLSPVPPVSLSNSNTFTIVNLSFHGLIRVFLYPLFVLIDRLLVCTYSYKPHSITVWRWNGKLISKAFLASCNCFWYDVRLKYFQFGVESNPALHSFCCEFIYDWCTNARLKPIINRRATSLDFPLAHCSIFLFSHWVLWLLLYFGVVSKMHGRWLASWIPKILGSNWEKRRSIIWTLSLVSWTKLIFAYVMGKIEKFSVEYR